MGGFPSRFPERRRGIQPKSLSPRKLSLPRNLLQGGAEPPRGSDVLARRGRDATVHIRWRGKWREEGRKGERRGEEDYSNFRSKSHNWSIYFSATLPPLSPEWHCSIRFDFCLTCTARLRKTRRKSQTTLHVASTVIPLRRRDRRDVNSRSSSPLYSFIVATGGGRMEKKIRKYLFPKESHYLSKPITQRIVRKLRLEIRCLRRSIEICSFYRDENKFRDQFMKLGICKKISNNLMNH